MKINKTDTYKRNHSTEYIFHKDNHSHGCAIRHENDPSDNNKTHTIYNEFRFCAERCFQLFIIQPPLIDLP